MEPGSKCDAGGGEEAHPRGGGIALSYDKKRGPRNQVQPKGHPKTVRLFELPSPHDLRHPLA